MDGYDILLSQHLFPPLRLDPETRLCLSLVYLDCVTHFSDFILTGNDAPTG
jgi:hypothetical protein